MIASVTRRTAVAVPIMLCVALAAACGGDRDRADSTAVMDSTALAPAPAPASEAGAMTDQEIVTQVGAANAAEIATNKLAADKATSADVKSFARKMIEDHQRLQGEMDSLATRLDIAAVPAHTDSLQESFDSRREELTSGNAGSDWDRQFMELQVSMHESTLDLLNRGVAFASNTELRNSLQQAVPVVQGHLDQARQILTSLGATPGGAPGGS